MARLLPALVWLAVAAPLAAQDMPLSQILIDGEPWKPIALGNGVVAAGLTANTAGEVFVADPASRRILRIDLSDAVHPFAETKASVFGVAFGPDGRLYGCQPEAARLVAYDSAGTETVIAEKLPAYHLVVTADGAIYCTVPAEKAVYRVEKDGVTRRVVDKDLFEPSGLVLWADGGTLVVADADDKFLWTYRVEKDGSLSAKERYYTLRTRAGTRHSDAVGLAIDGMARGYAATNLGVQVFDPTGRLSGVLTRPTHGPLTGLAFGGPERDRLFVGAGDTAFARRLQAVPKKK